MECLTKHEEELGQDEDHKLFWCSVSDEQYKEILSYNKIMNSLEEEEDGETKVWKFRRIKSHQGPLSQHDRDYCGMSYNVMVEWETGEVTAEPLSIIAVDDPITCAICARDNNLLHLDGWKRLKHIAK